MGGVSSAALISTLPPLVCSSFLQLHPLVSEAVVSALQACRVCWMEATWGLSDFSEADMMKASPFSTSFGDSARAAGAVASFPRSAAPRVRNALALLQAVMLGLPEVPAGDSPPLPTISPMGGPPCHPGGILLQDTTSVLLI